MKNLHAIGKKSLFPPLPKFNLSEWLNTPTVTTANYVSWNTTGWDRGFYQYQEEPQRPDEVVYGVCNRCGAPVSGVTTRDKMHIGITHYARDRHRVSFT